MDNRAHAADALGEGPGIPGVAALENAFHPPDHCAGTQPRGSDFTAPPVIKFGMGLNA